MRFPRIKVTTRRSMLFVAVVAVALGVYIHRRNKTRSDYYLDRAEIAASHREEYREKAKKIRLGAEELSRGAIEQRRLADFFDRIADYDNQMEQIYRRAAGRPWSPLPVLPPQPKF